MDFLITVLPILLVLFIVVKDAWRIWKEGLFLALVCAVVQLGLVIQSGEPIHYYLGGWEPPYGIEFVVDGVNGLVIVLVAAISWMTSL